MLWGSAAAQAPQLRQRPLFTLPSQQVSSRLDEPAVLEMSGSPTRLRLPLFVAAIAGAARLGAAAPQYHPPGW